MIVRKMAGQNIYKGSNSNGVRSLSLPKWRESFVVSGIKDEEKQYGTVVQNQVFKCQLVVLCFSGEA